MNNHKILFSFCIAIMTLTTQSEVSLASSHEEVSFLLAQTTEETETEEDDILTSTPTPIPTRSYIGIGGNIGLSGDSTPFGDSGFSLLGRTAITDNISLHTSSVFRDDGVSAFALTFGVPISQSGRDLELVYPFVGSGIAVEDLFGDFEVNALVTTGVDVPILRRLTGTVRLNFDFAEDDTNIGLLIGVGYNFSIFELF